MLVSLPLGLAFAVVVTLLTVQLKLGHEIWDRLKLELLTPVEGDTVL